ncbi:MAG: helix-turn-helix domain-containing protein [Betaproteobacteria bacterium]|nr:helix-turn-helix domain-containing protein [Betaproteobacteria bacterium]
MRDRQELPEQPRSAPAPAPAEAGLVDLFGMPIPSGDSPGRRLREARETRGLSIADVANSIKFSTRQIETVERDDFDRLPGATFVRGFIRSYAKLLQLDIQPLLAMLDQEKPQTATVIQLPKDTGAALPQAGEQRSYLPYFALLLTLLALFVAFATYFDWPGGSAKPASIAVAPIAQPLQAQVEQPAATSVEPGQAAQPVTQSSDPDMRQLIFVFDDKSWIEVKDATQRVIFAQNNAPGTRQVVNGKPPFALVIGNATHVQLLYGDQQVDLHPYTKVDVARLTLE